MTSSEPAGSVSGTSGVPASDLSTAPGGLEPGGAIGTAPPSPSTARRRARATGRGLFLALLIFVTVLLVLFVVFNTQKVHISLVFGDVRAPLIIALVIGAVLGGLIVGLAAMLRAVARRRSGS